MKGRALLSEPQSSRLDKSDIHDVLRNDRRRYVLEYLRSIDGETTARELSEYIAEQESGESPPPRNVRQSVYVTLQQTHLPKLAELDIVEYDENEKTVTLSDHAKDVGIYLEVVPKYGLSWSEFYAGLSVLGILLVLATEVGVPLLDYVSAAYWAIFTFCVIIACAVYQAYAQESSVLHRVRE
ncbi:hypothetical protein [Salarchaeum sp. JOR-1]|uniref:DUF7344 domain-containing protein n=1 Tax=Salarchaeum sp. JOR-1 TaxID=2599399 RepID=UPI001198C5C7|nr:hypothetical protein [Salarchaeum sp. JOR-1]QDX40267.1 hypothetical protein FQU85_04900 [Salarchaeum sp. JOR-1]